MTGSLLLFVSSDATCCGWQCSICGWRTARLSVMHRDVNWREPDNTISMVCPHCGAEGRFIDWHPTGEDMDTITPSNANDYGSFRKWRKTALSTISEFTVPAGTTFQTPEGLHAEDEECRVAFDSQGGVYPIRESVFQATYEAATE